MGKGRKPCILQNSLYFSIPCPHFSNRSETNKKSKCKRKFYLKSRHIQQNTEDSKRDTRLNKLFEK